MHTFFINTSNNIDAARHSQLFDNLASINKIKILNYKLEALEACAEQISEEITRDENLSENYNIIVYVEIPERNEHALAAEKVASLQIEEMLFAALYAYGRKPNQALILFGENFDRYKQYGIGNEYQKNVRMSLWQMFPLPDEKTSRKILKSVRKIFPTITGENINEYKFAVWSELTKDCEEDSLLKSESDFVMATIYEMAESIQNEDLDTVNLLDELYNAMTNQKEHVQKQVTAKKVKYAHVRLTDSDFHAKNRTEYRILLYAYSCAVSEGIQLIGDVGENDEVFGDDIAIGAATIPDIEWEEFSSLLKEKKYILEKELDQIELVEESFPKFNESLIKDMTIIALPAEMPKLFVEVKAHRGLTVNKLRSAVESTIDEIEEKNQKNQSEIEKYITMVTDSFSSSKDDKMRSVTYRMDDTAIKNDKLTKDYIEENLDAVDGRIAARKRLSMSATHIDDILKEARIRTEYCFDCLKKSALIYILGTIFTLLFAIPYAIVQRTIFDVVHGWLFYVLTLASVIAVYTLAYRIFVRSYKKRIIKELGYLCDKFVVTQKEKQQCLEEYFELIRHDIPLSFVLKLYSIEFEQYILRKNSIPEYITYHTKLIRQYIKYILNTLSELDIVNIGSDPDAITEYSAVLAIDRDKYQNNTLYSIVDDRVIQQCFKSNVNGGAN